MAGARLACRQKGEQAGRRQGRQASKGRLARCRSCSRPPLQLAPEPLRSTAVPHAAAVLPTCAASCAATRPEM